ncbi:MAG TPA: GvpL/GvpF family gas vesicle protein [Pyrinomonadaceae bacterium]|jgi:hypothetical protein
MRLYVYCLGDGLAESAFEGVAGVGGAPARVLALGALSAVVSDAAEEPAPVTEENLLAHNRVNAAALALTTPLPFRFGTLAAPERLAEYARSNEAALAAALARVRGRVEMSVKLLEKAEGPKAKAGSEEGGAGAQETSPGEAAPRGVGRGTAFLLRKRREVLGEESARRRAEELAAWLAEGLRGLAVETSASLSPAEAIVVRAAHLVERGRVGEYRRRLRALGAERDGLRLLSSGPWPPYSFSDVRRTTD